MTTNIKNQKEEKRSALMRALELPKTTRAIVLAIMTNEDVRNFLRVASEAVGVKLVDSTDDTTLAGVDACIVLDWSSIDPETLMRHIVVPIGPTMGAKEAGYVEFNPMKFEGNAFLFEKNDPYQIFAALVRYLENVRYPGDKRTLLKNVSEM